MEIKYIDDHLVVVNKPFCYHAQPAPTGDTDILQSVTAVLAARPEKSSQTYPVNRLDWPVGGLMIVARTKPAVASLAVQLQERTIVKCYHAVVEGIFPYDEVELCHYVQKIPGKSRARASKEKLQNGKEAVMLCRKLAGKDGQTLLMLLPETGRYHQIRVQLAAVGHPIVGDKKYGKTQFLPDKRIALFASSIEFTHPATAERIKLELDLPKDGPWKKFTNIDAGLQQI